MRTLLNDIVKNPIYAPGLSTYGIDGKDGSDGEAGNSIYYSSIAFINANFELISERISTNSLLSINKVPTARSYKVGDIFVDTQGKFFEYVKDVSEKDIDTNEDAFSQYFKNVGSINTQSDEDFMLIDSGSSETGDSGDNSNKYFKFGTNGRLINNIPSGLDIVEGLELDGTSEIDHSFYGNDVNIAALRIIEGNSAADDNANVNFLSMSSRFSIENENYLNLYYSKNYDAFVFDSNIPIVINTASLEIRDNNAEEPVIDGYSRITAFSSNISRDYNTFSNFVWEFDDIHSVEGKDGHTVIRILHSGGLNINDFIDPEIVMGSIYVSDVESGKTEHYIKNFELTEGDLNKATYQINSYFKDLSDSIIVSKIQNVSTSFSEIRTEIGANDTPEVYDKKTNGTLSRNQKTQASGAIQSAIQSSNAINTIKVSSSNSLNSGASKSSISSNGITSLSGSSISKLSVKSASESNDMLSSKNQATKLIDEQINMTTSERILDSMISKASRTNNLELNWNYVSDKLVNSDAWLTSSVIDKDSLVASQLVNKYYWNKIPIAAENFVQSVVIEGLGDINAYVIDIKVPYEKFKEGGGSTIKVALLGRIEVFISQKS